MTAAQRRTTPKLPAKLEHIYIIGICGTAMGSLAGMLSERGYRVSGSDQATYPPMSDFLASLGIDILQGYRAENINKLIDLPDLVVVGNVCRRDNPEVLAASERGLPLVSLPELLRLLFLLQAEHRVVVSGTHGKTTTSSLLAHLLEQNGRDPSFMIGGIASDFGSNFKLGRAPLFVIEGDEYDTAFFDKVPKFWHYEPNLLIINNIEFDHADIYGSLEEIIEVFEKLVRAMPSDGVIWANADDPRVQQVVKDAPCRVRSFGLSEAAELRASALTPLKASDNLREQAKRPIDKKSASVTGASDAGMRFELQLANSLAEIGGAGQHLEMHSPLSGAHNVLNTLAATGACLSLGLELSAIHAALRSFRGVRRRQELLGTARGVTVYDDFAHHPSAVRETVRAIRGRHPEAKLWAIFEAKSNTSRKAIFQDAYPEALAEADEVILSAPWRKTATASPDPDAIDIPKLVAALEARGCSARMLPEVEQIVEHLVEHLQAGDVVLGMSGSSFGNLHRKLLSRLSVPATEPSP
ncbi:MAG: Mur ligase family protein [Myxococcota bacterium]|jgi:UDP-N-acetylmuramate: L-alanyl-gamma-D-glutamyl-meso-diaminopimelate ligase|nr:Mur ligase family protein [Myxococcota bacterium]